MVSYGELARGEWIPDDGPWALIVAIVAVVLVVGGVVWGRSRRGGDRG